MRAEGGGQQDLTSHCEICISESCLRVANETPSIRIFGKESYRPKLNFAPAYFHRALKKAWYSTRVFPLPDTSPPESPTQ
jgi:hypothetical protein